MAQTIEQRMSTNKTAIGFDYLRIILAVSIIVYHSISLQHDSDFYNIVVSSPFRPLATVLLFMFFSLSGFLVAGSLFRNTLTAFLALRVLRIFPALVIEVILSAMILGPLFTTYDIFSYFNNRKFFSYMLNMFGYIHYELPGVFVQNPVPKLVNQQLWTVPFELECYTALAAASIFGLVRRRFLFSCLCVFYAAMRTTEGFLAVDRAQYLFDGRALVVCFIAGVLMYLYKDKIVLSRLVFFVMAIMSFILLYRSETFYIAVFTVSYCTVFIGLANFRRLSIMQLGDYSYGLYLFGFPIQQAIASFPTMRHWWANLPLALLFGLAYAAFSWNCVENPLMKRKKQIVSAANNFRNKLGSFCFSFVKDNWSSSVSLWYRKQLSRLSLNK